MDTGNIKKIIEEYSQYRMINKNNRQSTIVKYTDELNQFFKFIQKDPSQILNTDINEYAYHININLKNSINTQKIKRTIIRSFFTWYSKKYHTSNPAEMLFPLQEEIKIPIMPTPNEFMQMVATCDFTDFHGRRDAAILCLLIDTGIRLGECAALRMANIELHSDNFLLIVPKIKSKRERAIPFGKLIPGKLISEIWSAYYLEIKNVRNYKPGDPLFKRDGIFIKDGPLGSKGIRHVITKYLKKAEIDKPITPHSFRHFFATYSVINKTELLILRQLMGHAWMSTTERYIHLGEIFKGSSLNTRETVYMDAPDQLIGFTKVARDAARQTYKRETKR